MKELNDIVLGNRYNLIEKIGEGGMALVYKAKCQLLNRYVAVKILRPEFMADEEFIKKFKRESLAAASLSHPNIVGVYDVGEQEGIYYIVMEYVQGKTLKEYIKENDKLNYREALNITSQIASALEHAHRNGVVHRDIKPHNILVAEDKIIKVTDFGIAKASNSATIANTGSVMGSVHYFSPEQARGGFTDHRTDIYSLGVVLYEMLLGSLPFDAESPVTVALKHIQEDFVEPTNMDKSIPAAVNDIVVRAMEKDMNNRYQSAREMIDDIETARNNPYQSILRRETTSQLTQAIPIDEIDKAVNENSKTSKNKKNKKKKVGIILSGAFVLLIVLSAAAVYGFNTFFVVKDVVVPHIIGMQEEDGKKALEDVKLVFVEGAKQSSDKQAGEIIMVKPDEGTPVKENSPVTVYISSGQPKVIVPDLSGKSQSDASFLLDGMKFKVAVDTLNSDTIPKDYVISQNPLANSSVDEGSLVKIVVSAGPAEKFVTVPELIGKTEDEAVKEITANNLQVGKITYEQNSNFIDNVVIKVNFKGGEQVKEGQFIDITVNKEDSNAPSTTTP